MKLAYMYATPDVTHDKVTAIQGDPFETLEHLRAIGYTGVEFLVANPGAMDTVQLRRAVDAAGLDVPAICTGEVYGQDKLSFADPDPLKRAAAIERMKAAMQLGAEYGAPVNVGRLRGRYVEGVDRRQTLDWIAEALHICTRDCPGVRVVMEPVNHLYANCLMGTADMLHFVREVNLPAVGIMLDMAHMLVEQEDIAQSIASAGELLWHFHVTDSERLPLGDGQYDVAPILDALRSTGYDAYVTVETFQIPSAAYAAQASYDHLKPYFSPRGAA